MSSIYLVLKFAHILSGAVLFGTGLGIAYFMWMAHRSRNLDALRVITRKVILADWLFTATSVVLQPVTGIALMLQAGWSFTSMWFLWVSALYLLAGACWIPVVVLQYRIAAFAAAAPAYDALPDAYHRAFRVWSVLGVPAFGAVLALYALMVFKPGL